MKIVSSLISFVVCLELVVDNLIVTVEATALHYNVTSMKGAEDVYFRLKRRKPSMRAPREEKLIHKENVCLAILGSGLFDESKLEVVNPNDESVHGHLKLHQPKIHEQHYKSKHSLEVIKPKFVNPYRMYDVSVHGNVVREYVFACLARNCSTKNVERYFVSPEYEANGSSKMVRFVFVHNDKKEMVVIAMAERHAGPAHASSPAAKKDQEKAAKTTTEEPTIEESSYEDDDDYDEKNESGSW